MGKMKTFGIELANMVYVQQLSNEEILARSFGTIKDKVWLEKQIEIIRNNPKQWRPVSTKK